MRQASKNQIFALALFGLVVLGCASSSDTSTRSPTDIRNRPLEEQIVYLDVGKTPTPDDINVKRVRFLLDYLAENTTSSREEIGDVANGAVQVIEEKYGKRYTRQNILEGGRRVIDAIPQGKRGKKESFKSVATMLIIEASIQ
jgi:hypothetical protein